MAKKLTAAQIEKYRTDGYVYPVDMMSAADAGKYLAALEASERVQGAPFAKGRNFKPHLMFKWADELARHPVILDAVEDLIGPNIRALSTTVFPKPPGSDAYVGWHQDGTYFALEPDDVEVAVWVTLSDAPIESGCMEMQVASHRRGQLHHAEIQSDKNMLSLGQTVAEKFQTGATEFMPLKAGQASLHHTHTIHRSGPNRVDYRRVGVTLTYVPADVRVRTTFKPTAALVRGVDTWGTFGDEPRPQVDYGDAERAFQEHANMLFRKIYEEEKPRYAKPQPGAAP
jgi:non-heme Fe2+,alpha-ketoglutarate-dependent halogenase